MQERGLPRAAFVSTSAAADWMGVGEDTFEDLAAETDWMRPVYFGRGRRKVKRWDRDDVICLAHVWRRRQTSPPQRGGKNPGDEAPEEES